MSGTYVERSWRYDPALYAPARYRRACSYVAFVPDPIRDLELRIEGEVAALISEAEARIAALNRPVSPALAPLARLLLRTESIASSKVEGMQADARSLARAEVAHDTGRSVGQELAGILANVDAMQFAIETATEHPTMEPAHLKEIHRVLLVGSHPERAGLFRSGQGWIGGNDYNPCDAAYVPPPEEEIERLVDDLCASCNQDRLPPLVQAAIAHAQFETIHPFDDGNGRTGRALVQVLLLRRGLAPSFVPPLSVVLAAEKQRYIEGLVAFREDDLSGSLEIFASAAARSAELAQKYLADVVDLQDAWRARLQATRVRSDAAAWSVIEVLPGYPVITVAVALAALETHGVRRSRPALQLAVVQLEEAGVLKPVSASK
ncbi:MAG: Fic family protein, partial [Vicinamibacteria bacterium]